MINNFFYGIFLSGNFLFWSTHLEKNSPELPIFRFLNGNLLFCSTHLEKNSPELAIFRLDLL